MGTIVLDDEWISIIKSLAQTVRELRRTLGWSQDSLARRAGTSQGAVSRIESGNTLNLPFHTVVVVSRALAVGAKSIQTPLTPETKALLEFTGSTGDLTEPTDPDLTSIISLYQRMKPPQRVAFTAFFLATSKLLTNLREEPLRVVPHTCADACPEHHVEPA